MSQRDRISAAAWLIVRDAHIAEDIFQNVALKSMEKEVKFDSDGSLISWAFITARRQGIDWLRRQKNAPVSLDQTILKIIEAEWANESLDRESGRNQALRDCLDELPKKSRQLLKLRTLKDNAVKNWHLRLAPSLTRSISDSPGCTTH